MQKPAYSLTRQAFWASFFFAWLIIFLIVCAGAGFASREAVDLAPTLIPSMVLLIVSLLGLHRAFGSMDMRTIAVSRPHDEEHSGEEQAEPPR